MHGFIIIKHFEKIYHNLSTNFIIALQLNVNFHVYLNDFVNKITSIIKEFYK